jgi:hypothetical protein
VLGGELRETRDSTGKVELDEEEEEHTGGGAYGGRRRWWLLGSITRPEETK